MCGRYALRPPPKSLAKAFGVEEVSEYEAPFNIAPTQTIAGVLQTPDSREMKFLKWGLTPRWARS
jgi:putative SOS response-associated peptidase YedK